MFLSFEGIGGAGKTTQVATLRSRLAERDMEVVAVREPGATPLGEILRDLLLDTDSQIAPWAEAALFAASRAELVADVIKPALGRGAHVLCDRYLDSSLAYQGISRGLGIESVLQLNLPPIQGLVPDKTFLLLVDVDVASTRRTHVDQIERDDRAMRLELDRAYRELAALFPERIITIDADQPEHTVADEIYNHLRAELRDLS